ncbi:PAP2 family protein, partial [Poseidonibacter ostreae]
MQKNINKYIVITSLLLFFTLILFDLTSIDLLVQDYFFNLDTNSWIWDSNEPISKFLLYDGIKKLLIFSAFL